MDIHTIAVNAWQYIYNNYPAILAYLGAGGGIASLVQIIKKARKWDINDKDVLVQLVLGAFAILTSVSDYVINNSSQGAIPTIFGNMTPKLVVTAMLMHRIAVSPLTKVIETRYANFVAKAGAKAAQSVTVTGQITPHPTEDPQAAEQDLL